MAEIEPHSEADVPQDPRPSRPGDRFGIYRIERLCGEGGMGRVYACVDETLERDVAVKVLLPELASQPEMAQRFLREARAMAKVTSPYIVTVHHVGVEQGAPYLVMELLRGQDLTSLLQERRPDIAEALGFVRDTVRGLAAAAQVNLVHRDIKPSNLILVDGRIKITDFGLARLIDGSTDITRTGFVAGSPHYMAPELARAERATPQADMYALGATLYELLAGRHLFERDTVLAVVSCHLTEEPNPITNLRPELSPELAALVHRLLAKRPADRFADYDELGAALDALPELTAAVGEAVTLPARSGARPPEVLGAGTMAMTGLPAGSRRGLRVAPVLGLVGAGLLVWLGVWLAGDDRLERIDEGEAAAVVKEIQAIPLEERSGGEQLLLGHGLIALGRDEAAAGAYRRAAELGEVDDRAQQALLKVLDEEGVDGAIAALVAWPDSDIDKALLAELDHADWWVRHNALEILEQRHADAEVDRERLAILDLESGPSCPRRQFGLRTLGRLGQSPAAIEAVQKASRRMPHNLCMILEFGSIEQRLRERLE